MTVTASDWAAAFAAQRPRAQALFARARRYLAGGVGHDLRYNPVAPTYVERAAGARKWDIDGNEYVDYGMGNAALLLGHAHPGVAEAIRSVVDRGWHFGNDHPQMIEWAALICELVPSAERVRFVNSGTEGSMLALRLARAFTGRTRVLRFEGHFSGWGDHVGRGAAVPFGGAVSLGVPPAALEAIVVTPADLDAVEATLRHDPDIAAVMLEPSGASWGTVPLDAGFNRGLRELTARYQVPLIYDEVITGFRYSPGGYQQLVGITPDLTVLGKVVSGGMPGGAVVGRADLMRLFDYTGDPQHDRFQRVSHLGTFNANPLSAAAGLATLRLVADGTPQAHANRMADLLRRGMEAVLDELQVAGYVYGDASVFHVYLEAFPVSSGAATRQALRTNDAAALKGIPGPLVDAFQRNLAIHGVDVLSYTGGVTSAAHTEADIQHTIEAFRRTMRTLVEHNLVGRVG